MQQSKRRGLFVGCRAIVENCYNISGALRGKIVKCATIPGSIEKEKDEISPIVETDGTEIPNQDVEFGT